MTAQEAWSLKCRAAHYEERARATAGMAARTVNIRDRLATAARSLRWQAKADAIKRAVGL